MLLLGIPQEVAKKGTKGTPLGTPPPDGFLRAVGAFALASLPHLGRMSARPRWVRFGKNSCFPRLPLVLANVEAQHHKLVCDLSLFSLQSGKGGGSQGERLGAFLGYFLPRGKK